MKTKAAISVFICMMALIGCHTEADKPKLAHAQVNKQADKQALDFYAALINASQTNWTITITARTNTP